MIASAPTSRSSSAYDVTLDLAGGSSVSAASRTVETAGLELDSASALARPSEGVEVLAGSQPHLSRETQSLLRVRLRAASVILSVAFATFFIRGLFLPERDLSLALFHAFVLIVLAAGMALLASRVRLSLRQLRLIEMAIFGLVAFFFSAAHYRMMLWHGLQGEMAEAMATTKSTVLYSFAVMVIYGMFIPSTWRRAALVVAPMAILPPLVGLVIRARHAEVSQVVEQVTTYEQVSDNTLMMAAGAAIAIYGSHIINRLRVEAFRARRLGQYRLRHLIGSGGMGEVYLAEHQLLKRPCALKLIHPVNAADPKALARFEREVRTTAHLSHPNTVEIYDYGHTEDGTFYYVMEYLSGLSLAELVERHGPLPPRRVIYLLRQACGALAEAHSAGLVHRDIKPANIFAARRGNLHDFVKLLDFGLVKQAVADPKSAELSQDGSITGSPMYMSPEQATGERRPDARSDLYSLGAVAYFLLTGRAPFVGRNAVSVMVALVRDPVTPPSQIRPDMPEDLERVILRCLSKDRAERFATAEELDRALAECESAGDWDADRARRWWREVGRGAPAVAVP